MSSRHNAGALLLTVPPAPFDTTAHRPGDCCVATAAATPAPNNLCSACGRRLSHAPSRCVWRLELSRADAPGVCSCKSAGGHGLQTRPEHGCNNSCPGCGVCAAGRARAVVCRAFAVGSFVPDACCAARRGVSSVKGVGRLAGRQSVAVGGHVVASRPGLLLRGGQTDLIPWKSPGRFGSLSRSGGRGGARVTHRGGVQSVAVGGARGVLHATASRPCCLLCSGQTALFL